MMFIVFCHYPILYPGLGVVLDCIHSLPSFLLLVQITRNRGSTNSFDLL